MSTEAISYDLRQHISYLLEMCSLRAMDTLTHQLEEFHLNNHGYYILLCALTEKISQKQAAKKLALNVNTVTRLVDALEHLHYARRSANPENRKENFIHVTALGETIARRAVEKMAACRGDAYRDITKDECRELRRILLKLHEAGGPRL